MLRADRRRDPHEAGSGIPTCYQTVKRLMYGYLRDAYRDVGVFSVNLFRFEQLMLRMATEDERLARASSW